ncbi:DUF58 domain-containing protein [Gammaproteobacteria bacterium LSUCC0112]|nr:DUF58 domain-containing protein [Gammaproteobacteria bacterium LSUCC0112]
MSRLHPFQQCLSDVLHRLYVRAQRLFTWFPFTVTGVAVTLVCVLALQGFGYGRMDLVIFALTICGLSIVGSSVLMVTLSGVMLRLRIRSAMQTQTYPPLSAEAGFPNVSGFVLPDWSWLPLMSLDWQVVSPEGLLTINRADPETGLLEEEITPAQRCLSTTVTRRFVLRDVLGLCQFSWQETSPAHWQILPLTGKLRTLPVLRSMDAEDGIPNPAGLPEGDRMDIRRYAPGDSTRDILWRVYARNRHLNVRLAERSVFYAERTLAYLITGPQDEAAAGVARFAVSHGALGSPWVFGADGSDYVASTATSALPLIAGSRKPGQQNPYGLEEFLRNQGQQSNAGAHSACIIFAPATQGPWVEQLQHTLTRFAGPFTVVLAADGLVNDSKTSLSKTLKKLLLDRPAQNEPVGVASAGVQQLMAQFSRQGAYVLLIDRQSGQSFDQRLKRV